MRRFVVTDATTGRFISFVSRIANAPTPLHRVQQRLTMREKDPYAAAYVRTIKLSTDTDRIVTLRHLASWTNNKIEHLEMNNFFCSFVREKQSIFFNRKALRVCVCVYV